MGKSKRTTGALALMTALWAGAAWGQSSFGNTTGPGTGTGTTPGSTTDSRTGATQGIATGGTSANTTGNTAGTAAGNARGTTTLGDTTGTNTGLTPIVSGVSPTGAVQSMCANPSQRMTAESEQACLTRMGDASRATGQDVRREALRQDPLGRERVTQGAGNRGLNDRTPGSLSTELDGTGTVRQDTAVGPRLPTTPGLNQTRPGAQQPVTPLGSGRNVTPGTRPVNPGGH